MANTILTSQIITREAQRILHQKLNIVGNMNRQYDDRFAKRGAKIGTSLDLRLPAKFTVRTGSSYSGQNVVERKVNLPVATVKGVDMAISDLEMALSLDDFSKTILEPAMAQLAAQIEYDAINALYKYIPNYVGNLGLGVAPTTKLDVGGTFAARQGADVASANNLAVVANTTEITGTTQVNLIANTGWVNGAEINLLLANGITIKNGQITSGSNITILLDGAADFVTASASMLTLVLSEVGGTQAWREKSRRSY